MIRVLVWVGYRRWTGQLLIVLALSGLGCARGDWTSQTLTLVDVTGTWEGPYRFLGARRAGWTMLHAGRVEGRAPYMLQPLPTFADAYATLVA